ncbi:DUF393 domain-containing protein [Cellulomonas shaoxiangyii]|uniref:DUF393 domain-containing protein n=1 Tax=Cellulomonas shaoxiangyii TaxID=2566013 RepID=A0A4P7SN79_9CELL|nr:DUF393 domain-containing protein [Cellulomonas shaoxiangyii]
MAPGHALLVYDADCGFCTRAVTWADDHVRPDATPVASYVVDHAAFGLAPGRTDREMVLLAPGARPAGGALAAAGLLRRATGRGAAAWRGAGAVLGAPPVRWLAAGVYRVVARHRHRMPGGTVACRLDHAPSVPSRTDPRRTP